MANKTRQMLKDRALGATQRAIIAHLAEQGGIDTFMEIVRALGRERRSSSRVRDALTRLRERGIVKLSSDDLTEREKALVRSIRWWDKRSYVAWILADEYASVNVA